MIIKRKYKKNIAAAMLVLFVLCSVPKYVFHNIFSNHSHTAAISSKENNTHNCTIDAKIHCDCEDLYTDVFFNNDNLSITINEPVQAPTISHSVIFLFDGTQHDIHLRGPPTC